MLQRIARSTFLLALVACNAQVDPEDERHGSAAGSDRSGQEPAQYVVLEDKGEASSRRGTASSDELGELQHQEEDDQGMTADELQAIRREFSASSESSVAPDGLQLNDQALSDSEGYKLFEKCRKALNVETEGEYVTKLVTGSVKNVSFSITAPNAVAVFRGGKDISNVKVRFRSEDGENHEGLYCVYVSASKKITKLKISAPCGSKVATFIETGIASRISDSDCYIDYDAQIAAKQAELNETQVELLEALESCAQDTEGRAACRREANREYKPTITRIKKELKLLEKQKAKQDKQQ